ncbi:hypothetical protein FHG87_005372 [Trinorchestia longiramus]|nr:hypothetical protein FHG87_005372 [Trinorchestia longiramus]
MRPVVPDCLADGIDVVLGSDVIDQQGGVTVSLGTVKFASIGALPNSGATGLFIGDVEREEDAHVHTCSSAFVNVAAVEGSKFVQAMNGDSVTEGRKEAVQYFRIARYVCCKLSLAQL